MNIENDLNLIPEKYISLSLSENEIVLPYFDVIDVIKYFRENKISVIAWEGWAKYPDNKKGHFGEFQGTISVCRNLAETWNEFVIRSLDFAENTIKKDYNEWKINFPPIPELYFCLSITTKEEAFGDAIIMNDILLKEVENQLIIDLENYNFNTNDFIISWNSSCIEGKRAKVLDGQIENFSNIGAVSEKDFLCGWIDFIYEEKENLFIVYWDNLNIKENNNWKELKREFGIPAHVWEKIPEKLKNKYLKDKMKSHELPLP